VVIPALVAPVLAFGAAFLLLLLIYWVFMRITRGVANRGFRLGQLASGTFMAFTHGANDAQKTMGVIALALFANGNLKEFEIPTWVKISAGLAIALGTYVAGNIVVAWVFTIPAAAAVAALLYWPIQAIF